MFATDLDHVAIEQARTGFLGDFRGGGRLGVIATPRLTTEELYLVREIFGTGLGARVTAAVPPLLGYSDDFLIKADKTPNARGAALLGLGPDTAVPAASLIDDAIHGRLDALWIFGEDVAAFAGDGALQLQRLALEVEVLVRFRRAHRAAAVENNFELPHLSHRCDFAADTLGESNAISARRHQRTARARGEEVEVDGPDVVTIDNSGPPGVAAEQLVRLIRSCALAAS